MIKLRDFQELSHTLMIENFKKNLKVLLCIMAGGGKSITAGSFIAKYHKHFKFVLIVRKRELVTQLAEDALDTFDLDYSIFMSGHEKMDLSKPIQVCSKDTIQARDTLPFLGEDNVVVMVDECDEFPDYQRELIDRYFSQNKRVFYFGMTATPYNGLDFFDVAIEPIKPKELLARGILIPYIYIIPRLDINYDDVELVDGEWKQSDILQKLNTPKMIAASFGVWLEYGDNRQTLVFSINREHSKNTVDYINNYYGKVVAVHMDAKTSTNDRDIIKSNFKNGIIKFLCVVGLVKRGTNIVEIGCILDQAKTLRLNNHIQKIGRGSRKNPHYKDCILLDVANNLENNGGFYFEREIDLKSNYKRSKKDLETLLMRVCEKCFRGAQPQEFTSRNGCPFCGYLNKPLKKKKLSKGAKEKLFMETASEEAIEQRRIIKEFKKKLWMKMNLGKRYRKDIARESVNMDFLKKYGDKKMLKVQKATGLKQTTLDTYRRRYTYKPLEI